MGTEENPTLEGYLPEKASVHKMQAASQTVGFTASLFTYDGDPGLVQQAPVDGALQEGVPVALCTRIQ